MAETPEHDESTGKAALDEKSNKKRADHGHPFGAEVLQLDFFIDKKAIFKNDAPYDVHEIAGSFNAEYAQLKIHSCDSFIRITEK